MTLLKRLSIFIFATLITTSAVFAQESGFVVKQIRVQGLQRVNESTVLHYLPIKQGQYLTPSETGQIVSSLYATGFFTNVSLARQGNTLIINVQERPTIGNVKITGNKKIPTKNLQEVLKKIGIQEGDVYDSSTLQALQQSMQQQYQNIGMYNATVKTSAVPESRNRVAINIDINEGKPAHIQSIHIYGNHAFSEGRLKRQMSLTTWRPWTILTHTDQYSEEKFNKDLQAIHDFYLDHGYARFKIDSYHADMTPDKKQVRISIYVTEGAVYHIKSYTLSGNLLGQESQLQPLIKIKKGEIFSRSKIMAIDDAITHYFADQGYAFATVNPIPSIDDATREVSIDFKVNPGRRVYVRDINFTGNTKTQNIVLRREMRQEEGGLYNQANIDEGKRRLQNLGYLQNVTVKPEPVPGHPDQVDLTYDVSEMSSATASVQAGYSDMYGFLYGANLTENNWLGTGKQVSLGFQNSQYADTYSFTYANPYYTESGISRAITVFGQHVTPGAVGGASYTTNIYGANVSYGMPISEFSGISFGYGYQHLQVFQGPTSSTQINDYLHQHGTNYDQVSLNAAWTRQTLDRAMLPTRGTVQTLGGEIGVPVFQHPVDYYRLNYRAAWYQPITHGFIFHASGTVGYGYGYGPFSDGLPFFKNYFAGGIGSVRGFYANSLGPLDSSGNPLGGNVLTTGTVSLIIPNPWSNRFRPSLFVDGGNVFNNQFVLPQVRYAAGLGIEFYIPMVGPLEVSLAEPISSHSGDQIKNFDFSVGTSF